MFGYINVNKASINQEEYEYYHSYYCGLCHTLKRKYGQLSRLSLSFDLCFVALLLTQLYEDESKQANKACLLHPFVKHQISENKYIDYVCDMNIVLTYFKCNDDYKDEKQLLPKIYGMSLTKAFQKIERQYPDKVNKIRQILNQYDELEKKQESNIDVLAKLTGEMMEVIMVYQEDEYSKYLKGMANYLGRFIYIMDAYDDIEKDIKHHAFNPFKNSYQDVDFNERVKMMLEVMMGECVDYFDYLPIINHVELLKNILYDGIWSKFSMIYKKRTGDDHGSL